MISKDKGDKLVRIYFFIYDKFEELKYSGSYQAFNNRFNRL